MKYTLFLILFFAPVAYSQTCIAAASDPCVSVNQSLITRAAKAADELLAARTAIDKLNATVADDDIVIKNATAAIASYQQAVATGADIQKSYAAMMDSFTKAVTTLMDVIKAQSEQLGKPTSAWKRFLHTVEVLLEFGAGVAIGRI